MVISAINDTNAAGTSPLLLACMKDQVEMAQLLYSLGAPLNQTDNRGNTPFFLAVRNRCMPMIKVGVRARARVVDVSVACEPA